MPFLGDRLSLKHVHHAFSVIFCRPGPLATRSTIGKDCESLSSQIEDDLNAADVALSKSR